MKDDLLGGFYLGDLLVEPSKGRVSRADYEAHLPPVAAEVLLTLAANAGNVVSRAELLEKAWGPGRGSSEALSRAIGEIRHALDDHADDPRFIQTLPRHGYRLLVEPVPAAESEEAGSEPAASLLADLSRRGVIETGLAYLVTGWLIIQIADVVFEQLLFPRWAGTFVTVLVIAGFPVALLLAWFFELRDGRAVLDTGIHTSAAERSSGNRIGRAYASVFGAMVIAATGVFAYDQFVGLPEADTRDVAVEVIETSYSVDERSVAVLRFLNIDGSDRTRIFADGFAEDITHRLATVPGLSVSARGDAWTLPPNASSETVRRRLRVAYYLEGSVRLTGDTLTIVAQLIDSETGFHVVSRSFEEELRDFMQLQRKVTELIVSNMRVALPESRASYFGTSYDETDMTTYELYRKAEAAFDSPRTTETLERAVELYEQALEIDPDFAAAHAGLCKTYVASFDLGNEAADIERAEKACATALSRNPKLFMVHTALGDLYSRTGRLAAAIEAYEQALETNPQEADAMRGLANVYRRQQKLPEAEKLLRRAVDAQPGNWRTLDTLGSFLFATGRYEEAAEQYGRVAASDPDNFQALGNTGSALLMAGEFERAQALFESALKIRPNPVTYSNLATTYYYLGDFERAVEFNRQAVRLAPRNSVLRVNLADALHFAGRDQAAAESFEDAATFAEQRLAVDPNDSNAIYVLAWARTMLGQPGEASELVQRGLAMDPGNTYGYYYEALIALRAGETQNALDSLKRAAYNGYPAHLLAADPYLSELRDSPTFRRITAIPD